MVNAWAEPTHCPLCGGEISKPDDMDPELIECPEHGYLEVEVAKRCPNCKGPINLVSVSGSDTAEVSPCGCEVPKDSVNI